MKMEDIERMVQTAWQLVKPTGWDSNRTVVVDFSQKEYVDGECSLTIHFKGEEGTDEHDNEEA